MQPAISIKNLSKVYATGFEVGTNYTRRVGCDIAFLSQVCVKHAVSAPNALRHIS